MTLEELFDHIEAVRNREDQLFRSVNRCLSPEPEPKWWWDLGWRVRFTLEMIEWWLVNERGFLRSAYLDLSNTKDNPLIKRHSP